MDLEQIQAAEERIIQEYQGGLQTVRPKIADPQNHYVVSYPSLCRVSNHLCEQAQDNGDEESRKDAIRAIAHIAYGWMPTILNRCDTEGEYHEDGQTILHAHIVNTPEEAIKFVNGFTESPINTENAWVGLSKALHFINPKIFPIWDSNVANNFNVSATNNKGRYICYIEWCHSMLDSSNRTHRAITIQEAVEGVRGLFSNEVGYEVSQIRALEFILFVIG